MPVVLDIQWNLYRCTLWGGGACQSVAPLVVLGRCCSNLYLFFFFSVISPAPKLAPGLPHKIQPQTTGLPAGDKPSSKYHLALFIFGLHVVKSED